MRGEWPKYAKARDQMRHRPDAWKIETRDLGIPEETEVHKRGGGKRSHWEVGQEMDDYERILETANLQLPGSTDRAGFGVNSEPDPVRLTREHRYVGPAWQQKTIEIPESWQDKHLAYKNGIGMTPC